MDFHGIAGAVCRSLTASKDGPSLYDVCDPVLQSYQGGDAHLGQFYRTALGNPPLRALLRRTGLPALKDGERLAGLRAALVAARDEAAPDWAAVGAPVAALMDDLGVRHPAPPAAGAPGRPPDLAQIERVIRLTGAHLLRSFRRNGFIPTYAAFNLIGDPDMGGREMLMALTGLNARGYKNSTLLFSLARIFIAHSPARALVNPPWRGIAEPMWEPVQIRHRSAYYDAFFTEALLGLLESGLASPGEAVAARHAIAEMVEFCLKTSAEEVHSQDGSAVKVITALAPGKHPRFSRFFAQIKQDLGFGIYVPDCDTTACAFSAATQAGSDDPILGQPLVDFYRGYQVRAGANEPRVTVPLNDHIDYEGGVVTWIDNLRGERPYGNDLDPTLNLDILEVSFRNLKRWKIIETPQRLETLHRIIAFQQKLVESGAFKNPRSHIYYLPELYSAYFGRCYAAFVALPLTAQRIIDPHNLFALIRARVLGYVKDELITHEMNPFDAALALMALAHLDAEPSSFTPALHCIVQHLGEGGRKGPYKAYEWNKMKTPTRILVGGPEVTSAFVLIALALARKRMAGA
ncbi:hypothetical protein [Bradyrhizobium sp. CCBAU 51753]|uniref:hypothetical protein n=1 Tax=Bradyrhizobium sp. CCBAU 51753 TaxID=1325100 RepID=UPI00188AC95A|nr:hypothetical protein [Bradyrhizobium sp. CCBAU 51753]QOZ29457.1 hypothetical protein XH93_02340 [Bradyrhizobium sp. CCBAU 51753]